MPPATGVSLPLLPPQGQATNELDTIRAKSSTSETASGNQINRKEIEESIRKKYIEEQVQRIVARKLKEAGRQQITRSEFQGLSVLQHFKNLVCCRSKRLTTYRRSPIDSYIVTDRTHNIVDQKFESMEQEAYQERLEQVELHQDVSGGTGDQKQDAEDNGGNDMSVAERRKLNAVAAREGQHQIEIVIDRGGTNIGTYHIDGLACVYG